MIATSQDFASAPTVDIHPSQTQTKLGFEFRPIQLNLAVKLAHVNTSSTAQLIYLYLVDLRNGYKSGICTFPFTFRQIQKAFGTKIDEEGKQVPTFTLRTIKRAIKELQHSGLIQLMRTTKDAFECDEKLTFYLAKLYHSAINVSSFLLAVRWYYGIITHVVSKSLTKK